MGITADQIQEIERSTAEDLQAQLDALGGNEQQFLKIITSRLSSPAVDDLQAIRIYFTVLGILRQIRSRGVMSDQDLKRLMLIAETSLKICQIKPVTSRLSYLYRDLHEELARQQLVRQATWNSIASSDIATYLARDSQKTSSSQSILHRGLQSWQLGCIRMAKLTFHYIEQVRHEAEETMIARAYLIRCYRLSGDTEQLKYLINSAKSGAPGADVWQSHLQSESMLLEAQENASYDELHRYASQHSKVISTLSLVRCQLWVLASPRRDVTNSLKQASNNHGNEIDELLDVAKDLTRNLVKSIIDCYNTSTPLHQRLEQIGKRLYEVNSIADPELSLLFYAAAIRWLYRTRQLSFAKMLMECYQEKCLQYSQGHIRDSLQLLDKIYEAIPELPNQFSPDNINRLYSGAIPRFLKVSRIIAKSGYYMARYQLKINKSPEDFVRMQTRITQQIMQSIEDSMGTLRGPLLKIGQYLGITQVSSVELERLTKTVYDQPAQFTLEELISYASKEAGQNLSSHFLSIDPVEVSVASIGQVFRAVTHDQEDVAVKLKYPDIDRIIRMDLGFLRILTPLLRQLMPHTHVGNLWHHFERRFSNECDYLKELEYHKRFAVIFENDPHIHIPKVYEKETCSSMFVSEFISGERLDHFLKSASEEEREHVVYQLLYFFLKSTLCNGLWHIDPHPANFIVVDKKLAVLDFGAIHEATKHSRKIHFVLARSRVEKNILLLYDEYIKHGVIDPKVISLQLFEEGVGHDFLKPFHLDEVRPFYKEGELSLSYSILRKGLNHGFVVHADDFFSLTVTDYFCDVLAAFQLSLNWYHLYCRCLEEIQPSYQVEE